MLPTIHVVTQEKVVGPWRVICQVQEPQKVFVLAVYIADDLDGSAELKEYWLLSDNVLCFFDEAPNHILSEICIGHTKSPSFLRE